MPKVLFVCLGNICRSPLAEGIFDHLVTEAGLSSKIRIDSCGTSGHHVGEKADPRSIEIARQHDIELVTRSRQFKAHDLQNFDYVLAMDRSNYRNILSMGAPGGKAKVKLMLTFDPDSTIQDVPDPYYGGDAGFKNVYDMLLISCENLLTHIRKENNL